MTYDLICLLCYNVRKYEIIEIWNVYVIDVDILVSMVT